MVNVVGDIKRSTKFYIIDSKGSIQWVPSYELAEAYVLDTALTEWYGKTIYCTNEEFAYNDEGLLVLASTIERTSRGTKGELLQILRNQFDEFVVGLLNEIAVENEYTDYTTAISWINSSIEKYRVFAEKLLKYRDDLYSHVENIEARLAEVSPEELDNMDKILEDFKLSLPKFDVTVEE